MDYYQLLSVTRESTADDIQQAFFRLAKQFHPDRLGPEFADLRNVGARVFARLTQAQQTLSDRALRAEYDTQLTRGNVTVDDEQQRIQIVIQAATSFQKAEVLLKKHMLAAAELEATRALEGDPEQADYLALLAWIKANKPDSETQLPQILDQLNQAIQMEPENERIRCYRAQVLSRLGRQREALADFRFVVTKNPHHIDAQREIRIWEMRRRGQETAPGGGRSGTRTSSPPPSPSNHPSDSRHPARNSATPAPGQRPPQNVTPRTGVLSKLFKR
jgi:tetratricopeptide (TPR) repeat protein